MIIDIGKYIKTRRYVDVNEIEIKFRMDTSALMPILDILEKKGDIKIEKPAKCAACKFACPSAGKPITTAVWIKDE